MTLHTALAPTDAISDGGGGTVAACTLPLPLPLAAVSWCWNATSQRRRCRSCGSHPPSSAGRRIANGTHRIVGGGAGCCAVVDRDTDRDALETHQGLVSAADNDGLASGADGDARRERLAVVEPVAERDIEPVVDVRLVVDTDAVAG
jgi:hypothetical protein